MPAPGRVIPEISRFADPRYALDSGLLHGSTDSARAVIRFLVWWEGGNELDLRHTVAALMIAEGAHPEKIKRHLGHSSITVTMDVYGHMFPADDEAIAERLHEAPTPRPRGQYADKIGRTVLTGNGESPVTIGNSPVGRAGLEPATDGL
jgi:hypothetical protein